MRRRVHLADLTPLGPDELAAEGRHLPRFFD
jgi:hypothetical protein